MNVSNIPCTLRSQMKHHEPIVCYEEDKMVTKSVSNSIVSTDYKDPQVICMVDKNDE